MRKLLLCAAAMALFGGFATEVQAQDPKATADATVTLTVGDLLFVSVNNPAIAFNPGQTEFDLGAMGGVSNLVTTKGNIPYKLEIEADEPNFVYTGSASPAVTKPSTDFGWKTSAGATYTPLTQAAQEVDTFTPGQSVTGMDYEIALDWAEDLAGVYTLDIIYSVTPN